MTLICRAFFSPSDILCGEENCDVHTFRTEASLWTLALPHIMGIKEEPLKKLAAWGSCIFVWKRKARRETGPHECRQILVIYVEISNNLPCGWLLSWSYDISRHNWVSILILKRSVLLVFHNMGPGGLDSVLIPVFTTSDTARTRTRSTMIQIVQDQKEWHMHWVLWNDMFCSHDSVHCQVVKWSHKEENQSICKL